MKTKIIEVNKCLGCFKYCKKANLSKDHLCPKCQENLDNKLFVEKAKEMGLYEKIKKDTKAVEKTVTNKNIPLKKVNTFSVTKYLKEVLDKPLDQDNIDYIHVLKENNIDIVNEAMKYIGKKRQEKLLSLINN